eukprot:scaffold13700_cov252-Ochromonas_danica.AAC.5
MKPWINTLFLLSFLVSTALNMTAIIAQSSHHSSGSAMVLHALLDYLQLPREIALPTMPTYLRSNQVGDDESRAPGWAYGLAYSSSGCSGSPSLAAGVVANTCIAPRNPNASSPISYRISCTGGESA